jgi:hypothetical protein
VPGRAFSATAGMAKGEPGVSSTICRFRTTSRSSRMGSRTSKASEALSELRSTPTLKLTSVRDSFPSAS